MIRIVNYGMGNLRSVQKALELLGEQAAFTKDPKEVANAEKLILPGVGAFGAAMRNLEKLDLVQPIRDFALSGKPFLGICLGMQLLLEESEEQGLFKGLGIVPGRVVRFFHSHKYDDSIAGLKVPHMGWNTISIKNSNCPLLAGIPDGASFYFVHSFYPAPPEDWISAATFYGEEFCSVIWKDNVFATQFHPEKSGAVGLRLLRNFSNIGRK